ncbi:MAG TPA: DUF4296 domain-containing protein [Cyclobacteriaceae bacterium]|nr:DUF4296 domain-containing protein [Cyclobacteriaceae bacterium]
MKEYKQFRRNKSECWVVKWWAFTFICLLIGSSCMREKHPKDVLSKDEMVKVLSELYITEEKVNRLSLNRDSATLVFNYLNDKIFEKLGTTDSTFKHSMDYYMERPEEIEKIYAALIDSLNLKEQRLSIPK